MLQSIGAWTIVRRFNISVISLSIGGTSYTGACDSNEAAFATAINNAVANNISVVVASGNAGSTTSMSAPSCITNATSVSSTTKTDSISSFSNRNALTNLFAPGNTITSTVPTGGCINCDASGFKVLSGTSMAAPHASGVFALLRQFNRLDNLTNLTPAQIEDVLNDTGKQIDDSGGSGNVFSRVNVWAAIQSLDNRAPNITLIQPVNNSVRSNYTFMINISSSETLANASVEINSGNYTMAGTGLMWYRNISNLTNGTYTYKIYSNDSFGNSNITQIFTIQIDTEPPTFSGNQTNFTLAFFNKSLQFNITANDSVGLSYFIFSWNGTGQYENLSNGTLAGNNHVISVNKTTNLTLNSVIGYKFYANDTAGNLNASQTFVFTLSNAPPVATTSIASTDFLNRTNGTLQGSFTFSDADMQTIADNETKWYNNTQEAVNMRNLTSLSSLNTSKAQNWTFSVRVFDGLNWSSWVNSTKLTIANTQPTANISISAGVNETQTVNISINASDIDGDALTLTVNNTEFITVGSSLLWPTSLNSGGNHPLNVSVNDSTDPSFSIVFALVLESRDLDNDGNPDFNDTDDDNDNIVDAADYLVGNASSINTTQNITIEINGTTNLSKLLNSTHFVNISNGSDTIVAFNFTFDINRTLDLGAITLNRSTNGSAAVSVTGINLTGANFTKTIVLEKVNSTVDSVCIRDLEVSFETISSRCTGADETRVNCNNESAGQYTCFDDGRRYTITGLQNSAVKEMCVDQDGDGLGAGCAAGSDSCDTPGGCASPSSGGGGGGGGGGSGGGGGGVSRTNTISKFFSFVAADAEGFMTTSKSSIAVKKVGFTAASDVKSKRVTLTVINKENASATRENAYQYFEVDKGKILDAEIAAAVFIFEVNRSWLTQNELDPGSVTLYRRTASWRALPTIKINESKKVLRFNATSPGFSLFAIAAEPLVKEAVLNETAVLVEEDEDENISIEIVNVDESSPEVPWFKVIGIGFLVAVVFILGYILTKPLQKKPHHIPHHKHMHHKHKHPHKKT